MSGAPGVTITPLNGTPTPAPEASTTVSCGLLLALGVLVVAAERKKSTV